MNERIEEIRNFTIEKLKVIDSINDKVFQSLCLFSLLDCFAQEYGNYSKNSQEDFCNFILKYANQDYIDDLEKTDPITLYYSCEILKNRTNLSNLTDSYWNYSPNKIQKECINICNECKICKNNMNCKLIREHKYIKLLYKYRSKLVHEMNPPSLVPNDLYNYENISYYHISSLFNENDKGHWRLVFPYKYIKDLCVNVIDSYLTFCEKEDKDPFDNLKKKKYLNWYE